MKQHDSCENMKQFVTEEKVLEKLLYEHCGANGKVLATITGCLGYLSFTERTMVSQVPLKILLVSFDLRIFLLDECLTSEGTCWYRLDPL